MNTRLKYLFGLILLAWLFSTLTASAYYDPGIQRWINRDPRGEADGNNLYEFGNNSAYDYFDDFGQQAKPVPPQQKPPKPPTPTNPPPSNPKPPPSPNPCPQLESQWPAAAGSISKIPGGYDGVPGSDEVCKKFDCAFAVSVCRKGCNEKYGHLYGEDDNPACYKACMEDCKRHNAQCNGEGGKGKL